MNKIAVYLNEHLMGEVSSSKALRKKFSTDGSILTVTPEVVAFPRVTNDIRKVARFTWQLAEKGHTVPLTVRGFGTDTTGAAIGKGIVINLSQHLDQVVQIALKDKLIHAQAGASLSRLNEALKWHGMKLLGGDDYSLRPVSVGGAIASGSFGTSGAVSGLIEKLEVVLANGDVIETGRLSRRDVSKKLGLQTFEGEIYRRVSGLIEDNEELLGQIAASNSRDNTGYRRLTEVRGKDGSIDLTPLFIGSQGTLGIISEAVLRADFFAKDDVHAAITTDSLQTARDVAEQISPLAPAELSIYDGALFRRAVKQGARFSVLGDVEQLGAVVYVRFNDFNDRTQINKIKKIRKMMAKMTVGVIDSGERDPSDFAAITGIMQTLVLGTNDDHSMVPVINGASIPQNRREEFEIALAQLGAKHHLELPVYMNVLAGTYDIATLLKIESVGDKQKLFKLMSEYAELVEHSNGSFVTDGAEGRVKSVAAWGLLDEAETDLYNQLRKVFDPFGTLNPGVKQKVDLRTVVAALRSEFNGASML